MKSLIAGLGFSGLAFTVVKFIGYSKTSLTVLMYIFVIEAVALELLRHDLLSQLPGNLVLVVEEEEVKLKKLFTGEKYKVKGEIEKL